MGQKNRHKQAFLQMHPLCCFCGGAKAAVEVDHTPSRSFFVERDWPLEYEFPACETCNRSAGLSEAVCASIARVGGTPDLKEEEATIALEEAGKLFAGVAAKDPELIKEFFGVERVYGLVTSPLVEARLRGANGWPIAFLGKRFHSYFDEYVRKLARALFYKHSGSILTENASILFRTISNAQRGTADEKKIDRMEFPERPKLIRSSQSRTKTPISAQFDYSYHFGDADKAIFKVRFHQTFLVLIFINCEGGPPELKQEHYEEVQRRPLEVPIARRGGAG